MKKWVGKMFNKKIKALLQEIESQDKQYEYLLKKYNTLKNENKKLKKELEKKEGKKK